MNEYKIILLRDASEKIIKGDEAHLRRYIGFNYHGQIQKVLRYTIKVTIKEEGETEFKPFKTAW